ncbi:MAG: hypothetical protein KJZ70_05965 [Bryobacterales bacterium]|nr:hypothetical protein [Bryobacterales bacterium]
MNTKRIVGAIILAAALLAPAQTKVDIQRQSRGTNFLAPPFEKPVRSGATLPVTCSVGELYFLTDAPAGDNLYVCHTSGEWSPQGSAGSANVTIENNGSLVGTRSKANFVAGGGIVNAITDSGSGIDVQTSVNTAIVLTKAQLQAGAEQRCESVQGPSNAYACAMSPTLTEYHEGMVVYWVPDSPASGGPVTLNIDSLGAKPVTTMMEDAGPSADQIIAGVMLPLWYDGTGFRLFPVNVPAGYQTTASQQSGSAHYCASAGASGSEFTCSLSPQLANYTSGMVLRWRPDMDSAGGPTTLDIDLVGPKSVKLADGLTDPHPGSVKAGELYSIWYDGVRFRILNENLGAVALKPEVQSGELLLCESSGTIGEQFACELGSTLGAYQRGSVINWIPDLDASGPATLNINGLGAVAIKLPDGISDPGIDDVSSGRLYPLWYDGTVFRLLPLSPHRMPSSPRPACEAPLRGRLWIIAGATGQKDDVSVCAKDDTDAFLWRSLY